MEVIRDRELHEECGVFGIYGVPNAASLTYYGLQPRRLSLLWIRYTFSQVLAR